MARRSKGMAAFADAFSRSFGMGAQLAMKQKQIGAEYAWREQQETTRQRERGEDITRKAGVREDARKLAAKIRGEDVTYRDKRNVLEATRHQETTARKDKEFEESKRQSFLDRRSREKIAGMRKTGSAFNVSERSRLSTAQSMMSMIKNNDYMEPSVKVPAARAVHEYYIKDNLTPKTLESLVEAYRSSAAESLPPNEFNRRFYSDVLAPLGIIQSRASGQ